MSCLKSNFDILKLGYSVFAIEYGMANKFKGQGYTYSSSQKILIMVGCERLFWIYRKMILLKQNFTVDFWKTIKKIFFSYCGTEKLWMIYFKK